MSRLKIPRNGRTILFLLAVSLLGFFLRVILAKYFIKESGDLRLFADWAEKFWLYGPKDFYTYPQWYYAPPNYPPLLSLIYGGAYYLFDHKYVLAQLHNFIKIPPAFFIVYFYEHGLYLLLKLPGILGDIGLGILIFQLVKKLTGEVKKAFLAGLFYLFNPVSIFLSGVWGQTDSLVSFFGLTAFIALWAGRTWLSIPLLFLSFYIKPNWGIFIPLYIFLAILKKPQIKSVFLGIVISAVLFFLTTQPFAKGNVFSFSNWLWSERLLPTATVAHKASVSAFNFHSIFFTMDRHLDFSPYLGIPANVLGLVLFLIINIMVFGTLKKQKASLPSVLVSIFSVGFGAYLFLTNMLERYFFASFVPMIVLLFTNPGLALWGILINVAVFANLLYAFFRRTWGVIGDAFGANNFLLVRAFSALNLVSWFFIVARIRKASFYKKSSG